MKKKLFRASAVAAVVVAAAAWAAPAGAQTLTTEDFTASGVAVTAVCEPGGQRIRYTAEGVATGPYPGTFFETGVVTLGAYDPLLGVAPVTGFGAKFRIDSAAGIVRGRKDAGPRPFFPSFGECTKTQVIFDVADVAYTARIHAPTGNSKDIGCVGQVHLHSERLDPAQNTFHEGLFISDPQQAACP